MKTFGLILITTLAFAFTASAQNTKYAHGMVFGAKPSVVQQIEAVKLDSVLGRRTRISAVVKGKIVEVKKLKGGWFNVDAGNGKIIAAHFKNYNVNLPEDLKGHTVIIDGVVQRPLNQAVLQHYAGDKNKVATGAKQAAPPAKPLTLEVRGLMVN